MDTENQVRIARRIEANSGLGYTNLDSEWMKKHGGKKPSALMQQTPDESRATFEKHRNTASTVVAKENADEARRTTEIAADNDLRTKNTFSKKAHDRAGRVAMMRGGPAHRYGGGHRAQVGSWESDSDSE